MINILYDLEAKVRPVLIMSLPSFCKMALHYFCNYYKNNVFSYNHVIDKIDIDDRDTFETFIAFRIKYMNYSLEEHIEDLKKRWVARII
ncbi:MAG: hypothetical protein MRJ93_15185 [Nitrososphaeraceae archaeon]|nr:hypothetical protein [Nitrososphaeraceae archaeon]